MSTEIARNRYLEMLSTAFGHQIMDYLEQKEVIEILLNPDGKLFVETLSGKNDTGLIIPADKSENIIKLVAAYKNAIADTHCPQIATEIPFYSARFQGWLPPVVSQPSFAIRKRAVNIFSLDEYVANRSLSANYKAELEKAIKLRQNIVIVGGTGTGKTTFANSLLMELKDSKDRLLILEDLPELQVEAADHVRMVTSDNISMRDLVKGSLRMRPDRIIIGEVRDGAALDMLKAWNTGHPGGICTIHANSVESTPLRIEDLIQEVVISVPRNLILQAIDLIVYIERNKHGLRQVKSIARLQDYRNHSYQLDFIDNS